MRHLITGGAGFIGSHLAEFLIAQGDEVHIIDDLSTGRLENVAALRAHPSFDLSICSIDDHSGFDDLVAQSDIVHHLAAVVGVKRILDRPLETLETNIHGTERVLEAATKSGTRVMVASTSEVYGKSDQIPFTEDGDLRLGPTSKSRWGYAASKILDEFLALATAEERRLPVTVARLFNTVGPRQVAHYGMVLPTFVRAALAGEPIPVHGTGEQTRCFSSIHDVIRCWDALARADRAVGQVYNIGSDDEITITELAILVKEVAGSDSPIARIPYEVAYSAGYEDMPRRVPSVAKLQDEIGFRPLTSAREIVEMVVDHERQVDCVDA